MCFREVRIYRQGWIEKHANGSIQPFHHKKKFLIEPANEKPCELLKQREVFILSIFVKSLHYVLPFCRVFLDSAAAKSLKLPGLSLQSGG